MPTFPTPPGLPDTPPPPPPLAAALKQRRLLSAAPFQDDVASGNAQARVTERLGAFPGEASAPPAKISRVSGRRSPIRAIVAVVCLIALIAGGSFFGKTFFSRVGTTASLNATRYATIAGQRETVRLADGSVMTLAPATTAHVTPEAVTIRGEAYFDIVPRGSRSFVVHTANAVVQVLGTRFSVRQYPEERSSRVVVEDGKVTLQSLRHVAGTSRAVLVAHMLGQVADSTVTVTSGIAVEAYTGWTHGRLQFEQAPLNDILAELSRAYGAEIRANDSTLTRQRLTMAASVGTEPLTQILDFVGQAIDAHYVRVGKAFVLVPGPAAVRSPSLTRFPPSEKQYGR